MRTAGIVLLTLCVLAVGDFSAAEEALVTDRPDFTESAFGIGASARF